MKRADSTDIEPIAAQPAATHPRPRPRSSRRLLAGGLVAVALSLVLVAGSAFAQTSDDGATLGQTFVERLAARLGLSADELTSTVKETQLETIDAAVADGRLTEAQAERLRERVESTEGIGLGFFPDHKHGRGFMVRFLAFDTVAETIGMTPETLFDALQAGATLDEVIVAQGSTVDTVVAALVAEAEVQLAEAVAEGRITQERADEILAELPERLTNRIENGPGRHWKNDADTDAGPASDQV